MHFRWISFLASLLLFTCSFEIQGHIPDSLANPLGLAQSPLHRPFIFKTGPKSVDTLIVSLINQVNEDSIGHSIEHLQHYGTRLCFSPQAVQAQNWLQSRLQAYGYTTYIQNLAQPSGSSGNVIATLPGALYPNEYIVLGAHYDSYTGQAQAPGADDNASGTAGILEIARVLSQHTFSRSIVLCLWAAEELGCYGSTAYAQEAAGNNMNIMGYLNIDMCGYLYGSIIHTNVVGPSSAQPLMDFYSATCSLYLPAFQVTLGGILPGSSDHASFNTAGYMGIFPFEDVDHYSPYIHTPGDTLGSSVNSLPMAAVFTRAVLATALEMANQVPPPVFLTSSSGQQEISLHWKNPGVSATEYHIFRDDMYNVYATTTDTFFIDQNIITGVTYQYAVSLVSAVNGKESLPSNIVLGKSVGVMNLPFTDNFENGLTWWLTQQGWNMTSSSSHSPSTSLTDSPVGNYLNEQENSVYLLTFSLEGYSTATLTYWCKYDLEYNYDFVYAEVSDGGEYQPLRVYTGSQNSWIPQTINMDTYVGKPYVTLRFRLTSDNFQVADGFYLDDLNISVPGVGITESPSPSYDVCITPNPFTDESLISFINPAAGPVRLDIFNSLGQEVATLCNTSLSDGPQQFVFDGQHLQEGVYYYRLLSGDVILTGKMVKR